VLQKEYFAIILLDLVQRHLSLLVNIFSIFALALPKKTRHRILPKQFLIYQKHGYAILFSQFVDKLESNFCEAIFFIIWGQ
jgi:hypothetical protein